MDCDVLICGLGPVGQLLALLLGRLSVSVVALDAAPAPYDLPRAAVIDDEVLRIFQGAGVDAAILADCQVQRSVTFVTDRGRSIRVIDFPPGELGQPPLVSIHQPSIERTLVAALNARGEADLRWSTRVERVEQDAGGVTAWVRGTGDDEADGPPRPLRARYLVACDGGRSGTREALGIAFGGSTFAQRWLVVDTRVDRPLARVPHTHFVGDVARPTVCLPMSPGRHRWEWMLHPGEDDAALNTPEQIDALIAPWLSGEDVRVERAVVYTFHARTADRWRAGRVLLAGDAAHVMPPFVGQGFSSGARDAANLAWKLDAVLHGAPERLLDSYEAERRPHVRSMQRLAVQWGGVVQTANRRVGVVRDAVMEGLDRTRLLRKITGVSKPLPAYRSGAFAETPRRLAPLRAAGALYPQPDRLDEALGAGWAAVCATPEAAAQWSEHGVHTVLRPGDAWLRRHRTDWALLRPDRFVFACRDLPAALAALHATVGTGLRSDAPAGVPLTHQKGS